MPPSDGDTGPLTPMERVALGLSATGLRVVEVADQLQAPPEIVRSAIGSAITKLGARSKLEAVIIALRIGLIDLPR